MNELGRVALAQKKHGEAIAAFTRAINLDPRYKWALANRAQARMKAGDLDRAIADLDDAIRIDPHYAWALARRAEALYRKREFARATRDWEKTIAAYERTMAVSPKDSLAPNNLAWLLATCPIDRLRDGARAVRLARQCCELTNWQYCYGMGTLAAAYAETGDFEKALEFQNKALAVATPEYERPEAEARMESYRNGRPHREPAISTLLPKVSRE